MQLSLMPIAKSINDIVYTPDWLAKEIIDFFQPTGRCLDPCRGDGAFYKYLPPGADWCEISEGKDFYSYTCKVDWIVSNPPFSVFTDWMRHSMTLANDIVYLIPTNKPFNSYVLFEEIYTWGGIKLIYHLGAGRKFLPKDDLGYGVGAVHFQRNYHGPINVTLASR